MAVIGMSNLDVVSPLSYVLQIFGVKTSGQSPGFESVKMDETLICTVGPPSNTGSEHILHVDVV